MRPNETGGTGAGAAERGIGILPMAFAAGCAGSNVIHAPLWALLAALLAASPSIGRRAAFRRVLLPFCALLAGLAWGALRIPDTGPGPVEGRLLEAGRDRPVHLWVRGTVTEAEAWRDGSRVRIGLESFEWEGDTAPSRESVRAYLPTEAPAEGSGLRASLRMTLPRPATNPGQFDYRAYLARRGIRLAGSCRSEALVEVTPPAPWRLAARYRCRLREAIRGDSGDAAPVLLALLMGERGLLDEGTRERLSRSGLYHLVALSGLHVGLLLLVFLGASHLLRLRPGLRDGVSLAALCLYGMVVAPRPSILRALLMAGLYLAARMLARPQAGWRAWSAAGALLLGYDPRMILDTGFQMTFLATLGILHLAGAFPRGLPREGWAHGLFRLLWVGFCAQLAVLPILVYGFHRVSLLGWLCTPLAALPILGIQTVGVFYMAGGAFLPGIGGGLACVLDSLGRLFLAVPEALGRWDAGALFLVEPSLLWAVLFGVGFLALGFPGRIRGAGWVLVLFSAVGAWSAPRPFQPPRPPALAVLDVGQASCQVLVEGRRAWLADAGNGVFRGPSSAQQVIEPFLARAGISRVDGVLLTHWDADHAGSLEDLVRDLPVGFLAYPATDPPRSGGASRIAEGCRRAGVPLVPLRRGDLFEAPGLRARILHPPRDSLLEEENERCLVFEVPLGGRRLLFTGDIGGPAERDLLDSGGLSPADLLMVPHHGSGNSSTAAFIEAISPRWAIVSVGWGNRFNHPSERALGRYGDLRVRLERTDRSGAVLVTFPSGRLRVERYAGGGWREDPFR